MKDSEEDREREMGTGERQMKTEKGHKEREKRRDRKERLNEGQWVYIC